MRADFTKLADVLGLNRRNIEVIRAHNPRSAFPLVDDKIKTKEILTEHLVPSPETVSIIDAFPEIEPFLLAIDDRETFVVKPARGRAGGGVLIAEMIGHSMWKSPSGRIIDGDGFRKHLGDILFGVYSFGRMGDSVLVEARVVPHRFFREIYHRGIADIRVITFKSVPIMAMLRIPTDRSDGKANLHQGAIGIGVNIADGRTTGAVDRGKPLTIHPDSRTPIIGLEIPYWEIVLDFAVRASRAVPLEYVGVDLVIDEELGPLVLELNARPGLQIQVVNNSGLVPEIWRGGGRT